MAEHWKIVPISPRYMVSDQGRVMRGSSGQILSQYVSPRGYPTVTIGIKGKPTPAPQLVHRLVALAFIGPPPRKNLQVAHGNGIRHDNRVENLRWATPKENGEDKVRHGNARFGERNGNARLPDDDAADLLRDRARGLTQYELADKYGISQAQVWNIVHGKQRRHLHEARP